MTITTFQENDAVDTVWGAGRVQSYRASDNLYIVHLDHWKLAQGQSPTLYLGADSMRKSTSVFDAGDAVNTVWGVGRVQSQRASDGLYVVLLDQWKLAQGQSPTLYLGADAMTRVTAAPAFQSGDSVDTVWGAGKVKSYRASDDMYIVLLDHWKLAQGQSPTLYLGADSMSKSAPAFKAGDEVETVWGAGTVQSYRASDGLYIVLLNHWKLAQGQSPTLYLGADAMKISPFETIKRIEKDTHAETKAENVIEPAVETHANSDENKYTAIFKEGDAVDTVWGAGKVTGFRASDGLYIVLLNHWKLAQGQSPTLYLGPDSIKLSKYVSVFGPGDAVDTVWGVGKVQRFRPSDGMYVVLLDNWKLAQGQSPTLYLGSDAMESVNKEPTAVKDGEVKKATKTKADPSAKAERKSSCVIS